MYNMILKLLSLLFISLYNFYQKTLLRNMEFHRRNIRLAVLSIEYMINARINAAVFMESINNPWFEVSVNA